MAMSPVHRLPPDATEAPGAIIAHSGAALAGLASVGVVLAQSEVALPLAGMGCAFCLLFWIRRRLPWPERAFYALASFFAALPFVWPAIGLVEHHWPVAPPSARMSVGFLLMLVALPFVAPLRKATRQIEENPSFLLSWINNRIPERWRFKPRQGGDHD
jgi:hypothetical protein